MVVEFKVFDKLKIMKKMLSNCQSDDDDKGDYGGCCCHNCRRI